MKYHEIKNITRRLRDNVTPEEEILWRHLRLRKLEGRKFLRQHAIIYESRGKENFFFVPDFYCASEKLVVELDGKIHERQKEKDKHRDEILINKRLRIIRIKNEELQDISKVLNKIKSHFTNND